MNVSFERTPVTLIIAAVAAAIELVSSIDPARRDVFYITHKLGILSPVFAGELWRPFTTALLHGGVLHAAFNVFLFFRFGSAFELRYGSYRMLGMVGLLSYGSMMPQYIVSNYNIELPGEPQIPIVGLSGVLYGLFGFVLIARRYVAEFWQVCDQQTVFFLLGWLVFCVVATKIGLLPVANVAHLGGLLFGVLYALAVYDARRGLWRPLAVVATLLVLGSMFYCPGHKGYEYQRRLRQRNVWIRIGRAEPVRRPAAGSWIEGEQVLTAKSARPGMTRAITQE